MSKTTSIRTAFCLFALCVGLVACAPKIDKQAAKTPLLDTALLRRVTPRTVLPSHIRIEKALAYDLYTLDDTYPYRDTVREFQWQKMRELLALLENAQLDPAAWGILQNRRNLNGEAPLVKQYRWNAYKRIEDTLGVERYQSVPLYAVADTLTPERYGRDGTLVKRIDSGRFARVEAVYFDGEWLVPERYVKPIDSVLFTRAVFVDRTNQNIATLERTDTAWLVRSMNPATTGRHHPPYQMETPLGIFVVQEKREKMVFLKDGTTETGGFAPWASRFSNGGYIHGVPVNAPRTALIEYSWSLGTTPRSHMCVRNATSHAKYVYDWAPVNKSLVFVLE